MTQDDPRTALHGPWPTPVEELQADHPEWEIWREITEGRHGDWHARREPLAGEPVEVTAITPDDLRERIRKATD